MKIQFGYILKDLRKSKNLSQQELANYLCISRPTYLRFEKNLVEAPLSKLFELSELYQLDVVKLISKDQLKRTKQKKNKKLLITNEMHHVKQMVDLAVHLTG
ncbi:helix-turn-helix domain-containing protein [Pedobacter polaris]|nr:helix-turn-helix transcriptional regulator [Pedobacter polaris]